MKIHPVEPGFFHVGKQTDMTKLMVAFRNFSNVPVNGYSRRGMGGMDWIDSAQDRDRTFANAVMNNRVPQYVGNFLTS
jgi:hypothetical protein